MSNVLSNLTDQLTGNDDQTPNTPQPKSRDRDRDIVERNWRTEEDPPENEEDQQDDQDQCQDQSDGGQDQDQGSDGDGQDQDKDDGQPQNGEGGSESDSGGSDSESSDADGDGSDAEGSDGSSGDGQDNNSDHQDGQDEGQGGDETGGDSTDGQEDSQQQDDGSSGKDQGKQSDESYNESGGNSSGGSGGGERIGQQQADKIRENRSLSSEEDNSGEEQSEQQKKERKNQARELNDDAFSQGEDESNWDKSRRESRSSGRVTTGRNADTGQDYYTDDWGKSSADRIENKIQQFAYEINENDVGTDWTPKKIKDHKIATMFALMVAKLAEDMSYTKVDGDRFWDTHKIMKRQITKRPLHQCKHDYEKSRLALLVDTSPSCREEAMFYSKIASGAMLRDDIDIFLCPNGRIDAKFDPKPMRFVRDKRREDWKLDGRVVMYFTDWDGSQQIVKNSKDAKIYWFDNTKDIWDDDGSYAKNTRFKFRGEHYYVPDPTTFKRVARKIRP